MERKSGEIFEEKTAEEIAKLKEVHGDNLVELTEVEAKIAKALPPFQRSWFLSWTRWSTKALAHRKINGVARNFIQAGFEAGYKAARLEIENGRK